MDEPNLRNVARRLQKLEKQFAALMRFVEKMEGGSTEIAYLRRDMIDIEVQDEEELNHLGDLEVIEPKKTEDNPKPQTTQEGRPIRAGQKEK